MAGPTKSILDLQSDLKQPNVPAVGDDVANKDYVDTTAATPPDATSGPGGATKGIATFDEDKGLQITGGPSAIAEVKPATSEGIGFNGSGEVAVKLSSTPADQGLEFDGSGNLKAKVDGSSIGINAASGELETLSAPVADATSAPGGGTKGIATFDEDFGLEVVGGASAITRVKADNTTIDFNPSGELRVIGGGGSGALGDVSRRAGFTRNITAVTPPTPVTIGTNIDALSFPDSSTTGQRFEAQVPDDYFNGDLDLLIVYRMDSAVASPNNQIRIETAAEIVDTSAGVLDTASYPATAANFTVPDNSTDITRQTALTITSGDFNAGDTINFLIKRLGGDAQDLHTGAWEVISFEWRYQSVVDSRIAVQVVEFLSNAPPDPAPTPGTLGSNIDTTDYAGAADEAQKFSFIVPENWDGISDALVQVQYAMSSAAAAVVRLETFGEVADVSSGSIVAIPTGTTDVSTPNDTDPHRVVVRSVPSSLLSVGSDLTMVLKRLGTNPADTHGGDFKLISVSVSFLVSPTAGFTVETISEDYLEQPVFNVVSVSGVNADIEYPSFGTTFDALVKIDSTVASGRADVAFPGRLNQGQTTIDQMRINIVGLGATPEYRLAIYAEGSGASPVFDTGVVAAPGALTEVTVLAASLSAQPVGQKRYHVVVEAHVDSGEEIKCSLPFSRQV